MKTFRTAALALVTGLVTCLSALPMPTWAVPVTAFTYSSTPTSWVGLGETVFITPETGSGFKFNFHGSGAYGYWLIDDFESNPDFFSFRWWHVDLAPPRGERLEVGAYEDAQRAPFREDGRPGIDIGGNGRGNNTNTGRFDVLEAEYEGDVLTAFAANFIQYDGGNPLAYITGEFRYNSSVPLSVAAAIPEPSQVALLAMGLVAVGVQLRRGIRGV